MIPMIEIENISKNFGQVQAVNGLSLTIPKGEFFCFLGPNGAGKTTTIKMMTGLLRPTTGRIRIGGLDLHENPVSARQIMGYIPDFPYLYDRLTASEFFQFIGDLYRIPPDRVETLRREMFELFGLMDYEHTLIKDLSHGFRQRVVYTATLMHEPQVLFVDEPFIGLDPYTIRMIKELLKNKTREGMTIFLTTHILALIEDLADRIGIIVNGKLAALGTLPELLTKTAITSGSLEEVFFSLAG